MTAAEKNELHRLFKCINQGQLTGEEIRILQLYFVDNKTEKMIGEALQVTRSQARQKLAKARFRLMKVGNHPGYIQARTILYGG